LEPEQPTPGPEFLLPPAITLNDEEIPISQFRKNFTMPPGANRMIPLGVNNGYKNVRIQQLSPDSSLLNLASWDSVPIEMCAAEPGQYVLSISAYNSLGSDQNEVQITVNEWNEDVPIIVAGLVTIIVLAAVVCSIIATLNGYKSGNIFELLFFVQFLAILGALQIIWPTNFTAFYDGLTWIIFHLPFTWEQKLHRIMPGSIFSHEQPIPSTDNTCPFDVVYLWFPQVLLYSAILFASLFILAFLLHISFSCFLNRKSLPGRIAWWKFIYIGMEFSLFPLAVHSFRVLAHAKTAMWWKTASALAVVIVLPLYVIYLTLALWRKVERQRTITFRMYTDPKQAGTEATQCTCWGLFRKVGEWENVKGGELHLKNHGYIFRKFRYDHNAFLYYPILLGKLFIQAAILGLVWTLPSQVGFIAQVVLLAVIELVHFFYLVIATPYVDTAANTLAVGSVIVECLLLLLSSGIAARGHQATTIGTVMWAIGLTWVIILLLNTFRWSFFSKRSVDMVPLMKNIQWDISGMDDARHNQRSVWDEFPTYMSDTVARNVYVVPPGTTPRLSMSGMTRSNDRPDNTVPDHTVFRVSYGSPYNSGHVTAATSPRGSAGFSPVNQLPRNVYVDRQSGQFSPNPMWPPASRTSLSQPSYI